MKSSCLLSAGLIATIIIFNRLLVHTWPHFTDIKPIRYEHFLNLLAPHLEGSIFLDWFRSPAVFRFRCVFFEVIHGPWKLSEWWSAVWSFLPFFCTTNVRLTHKYFSIKSAQSSSVLSLSLFRDFPDFLRGANFWGVSTKIFEIRNALENALLGPNIQCFYSFWHTL